MQGSRSAETVTVENVLKGRAAGNLEVWHKLQFRKLEGKKAKRGSGVFQFSNTQLDWLVAVELATILNTFAGI